MRAKRPDTEEGQGERASHTPRPGPLRNTGEIQAELSRIYRSARQGKIPVKEASSLCFILATLGKMLETREQKDREEERRRQLEDETTSQGTIDRLLEIREAGLKLYEKELEARALSDTENTPEITEADHDDQTEPETLEAPSETPPKRRYHIPGIPEHVGQFRRMTGQG